MPPPGPFSERPGRTRHSGRPTPLERLARFLVLRSMRRLEGGELKVLEVDADGTRTTRVGAAAPEADGLNAEIVVQDPAFWPRIALGGSVGAGEAFVEELWSSPSVTDVVRLVARNPAVNGDLERGLAARMQAAYRMWHLGRENTRGGSRTNVAAHYDLGNDFFERLLDPSMTYSCALFDGTGHDTLEEAQRRKLDLVCTKLALTPSHQVVEIGTGWGSFAIHAALRYGCKVFTTTISERQHEAAERRIRAAGVEDRVTLLKLDYRDLPRQLGERRFDRLVSIEMIEAVGEAYLERYLDVCSRLLANDGLALIQAILISEEQYAFYRGGTDFIQRYVFPGGFLPSMGLLRSALESTSLRIVHVDDLTAHYPPTLRAWAAALHEHSDALERVGFSPDFLRLWDFYLSYCEGGFLERTIGDAQLLLAGADARLPTPPPVAPRVHDGGGPFIASG